MSSSEWPTLHRAWQEAGGEAAVLEGEDRIFDDIAAQRSEACAKGP